MRIQLLRHTKTKLGTEVSSLSRDKGTTRQKSLHCLGTNGQWDKLKILSQKGLARFSQLGIRSPISGSAHRTPNFMNTF